MFPATVVGKRGPFSFVYIPFILAHLLDIRFFFRQQINSSVDDLTSPSAAPSPARNLQRARRTQMVCARHQHRLFVLVTWVSFVSPLALCFVEDRHTRSVAATHRSPARLRPPFLKTLEPWPSDLPRMHEIGFFSEAVSLNLGHPSSPKSNSHG
jgi:hypothetical protein